MSDSEPHLPPLPPQRVGVRELRGNLTAYLCQVRQGASFLVTCHDQVLAELRPPSSADRPPRRAGALRGRVRLAPDFDLLSPDLRAAMQGEED